MKQVAIFAKVHDPRCQGVASELVTWLEERKCLPLVDTHLARHVGYARGLTEKQIRDRAELVVVLGGDGTLISVARLFSSRQVPIVGVNLGSLGFLTEITVEQLYPVLEQCLADSHRITERMMLDVTVTRGDQEISHCQVLNDAVINKGALARIIELEARVNDDFLTNFKADGLIISTPTGSTGYSLSAGGPIVQPLMKCVLITPICPHTLTNRPIVLSYQSVIRITVKSSFDEMVYLTLDGQVGVELQEGDCIEVSRAETTTALVTSPEKDYFAILRAKLKWGER
ncbi:NAD(+)/NADH kinase [Trichlorobacter lovleyi]|jgi:Predicted sugar kinase|uniref:NAD kinase n=1 Tax=Trichlorobacter lovleyi (strain ATCC BAA-1151 / DSM 17278 / SZ) TaxID=398767 RepID=NADK_TRIL1|nr:NAD(+)/NADH kinase [Trichlorobacter lovleyi]B3E6Y9.1 RecName: Full=NAD kinase; AltName: Full=ATP-dependent NAD kinase [Trichlorobacter lovleyi SZ]ACD96394.1 ATP-NAD/AcoX kinase [Trichlorobacter lovleyi SZ]